MERTFISVVLDGQCNLFYLEIDGSIKSKWFGRSSPEYRTENGSIPNEILEFFITNLADKNPPYNLLFIWSYSDVWYDTIEDGIKTEMEKETAKINRNNLLVILNNLRKRFPNADIIRDEIETGWEDKELIPFP